MPTKVKPTSRTISGSNPKSKISTKLIAAIIVGIVAIAGIIIVFSSFASGPPPYQYQYSAVCENLRAPAGRPSYDPNTDCVKDSAEAMAYRLYKGAYGKVIDNGTYNSYTQKLAGDRTLTSKIVPESALASGSDQQYISSLYKNLLNRNPSTQEITNWVNEKSKQNLSRGGLLSLIAQSAEAKKVNAGKFAEFLLANLNNKVPTFVVTPVAQNQQNARTEQALVKLKEMASQKDALLEDANAVQKISQSSKTKAYTDRISLRMIRISQIKTEIDALTKESQALTAYATNISDRTIVDYSKLSNSTVEQAWRASVNAGTYAYNLKLREAKAIKDAQKKASALAAAEGDRPDSAGSKSCKYGKGPIGVTQSSLDEGFYSYSYFVRVTNLTCNTKTGKYKFSSWSNWIPATQREWSRHPKVPYQTSKTSSPPSL